MYQVSPRSLTSEEAIRSSSALLDAVSIRHGPMKLLNKAFLAGEAHGLQAGVHIRVNSDMAELVAANRLRLQSWSPIVPIFNPVHSDVSPDTAFWLSAHDRQDDSMIATCAVRRLDIKPGGLLDEFTSLRIFYRDPTTARAAGTICFAEGPVLAHAAEVHGKTAYIGALWTDPCYRGRNIVYIFGKIARALAVAHWNVDSVFGIFRVDIAAKGVLPHYGYSHLSRVISVRNSYRGDFDVNFGCMDAQWIERVLADYVAERNVDRVTEAQDIT